MESLQTAPSHRRPDTYHSTQTPPSPYALNWSLNLYGISSTDEHEAARRVFYTATGDVGSRWERREKRIPSIYHGEEVSCAGAGGIAARSGSYYPARFSFDELSQGDMGTTLEALFDASVANGLDKVKIREVWAVDCPNHGHAGILNREMLKRKEFETFFGCEGYAIAVHHFLLAAPTCFGVDFSKKRLVGLGHSLGANGLLLLQALQPIFPFLSLIIVEPVVEPGDGHDLDALRQKLVGNAINRKSEWRSRDEAFLYLKEDSRTKRWDEKVMKAFVKHAIGESPSGTVTLACMPQQERIMYLDMPGATRPVGELTRLCPILPVHLIIGLSNDFIPRVVHDRLIDPTSGRQFASVSEVPQVGHLMPQEIPKKLGVLVYELLTLVTKRPEKLRAMY